MHLIPANTDSQNPAKRTFNFYYIYNNYTHKENVLFWTESSCSNTQSSVFGFIVRLLPLASNRCVQQPVV